MQERLRAEDLTDRRRERRRADLLADPRDLLQHLRQPILAAVRPQLLVERRDEPDRHPVLRRSHGDPRRERGDRLVADVLVDEVGRLPQLLDVDRPSRSRARAAPSTSPSPGDAVDRERDRVDGAGDEVGAGAHRLERGRERGPARTLAVEADRQIARLAEDADELPGAVRLQRAGRVVQQDPGRAELRQRPRLLGEGLRAPGAVDEAGVELLARLDDRLGRFAQVRDVVQRVVQPEDVDPALGGRGDEPPREVAADRSRPDEEAPAQRERERRLRPLLERADPLPRALDAAPDGAVEDAAAGDLEVREAGPVEDLREPQQVGVRDAPRERLLPEDPDRGVDESRHAGSDVTRAADRKEAVTAGSAPVCGRTRIERSSSASRAASSTSRRRATRPAARTAAARRGCPPGSARASRAGRPHAPRPDSYARPM